MADRFDGLRQGFRVAGQGEAQGACGHFDGFPDIARLGSGFGPEVLRAAGAFEGNPVIGAVSQPYGVCYRLAHPGVVPCRQFDPEEPDRLQRAGL